jgi:hypothetical protein
MDSSSANNLQGQECLACPCCDCQSRGTIRNRSEIVIVVSCSGVGGKPDNGVAKAAAGVAFAVSMKAGPEVLALLLFIVDIVDNSQSIAIHSEGDGRIATTIDWLLFFVL